VDVDIVPPSSWRLWFGLLGGHVSWTLQLVAAYYATSLVCHLSQPAYWALHYGAALVALAVTGAAGAVSYRQWRRLHGDGTAEAPGGRSGRSALLAVLGVLLSAIYLLVIALSGASPLLVRPCH